jgi:hypothetical protein
MFTTLRFYASMTYTQHPKASATRQPPRLCQTTVVLMPALKEDSPRGLWGGVVPVGLACAFAALSLYLRTGSFSPYLPFEPWFSPNTNLGISFSRNVSSCPGSVFVSRPSRHHRLV